MRRLFNVVLSFIVGLVLLDALKAGGLVVLAFICLLGWYWTLRRGLLTVRAFMYLGMLSNGIAPMEANWRVFQVGYRVGSSVAPAAKSFVRECYGGKQLPMIAEARKQGFVG